MRDRAQIFGYIVASLLIAMPAWGVAVTFETTDASGEPLGSATVSIGDLEVRTDATGRATMDIPAEEDEEVAVVVTFGDEVVYDGVVRVRTGRPITIRTTARLPMGERTSRRDGFGQGSPGTFGHRGPSILGTGRTERFDVELEGMSYVVRTTTGMTPGSTTPGSGTTTEETGSLSPSEIAEARANEEKRHEIPNAFGVEAVFPIPRIGGGRAGHGLLRPTIAGFGAVPGAPGAASPAGARFLTLDDSAGSEGGGRGGVRVYPAAIAGIAQADIEFHSRNLVDGNSATFAGDGILYRLGLQGTLVGCGDCRWFGTLGYEHAWTGDIDVDRSPGLQGQAPAGINVAEDKVVYKSSSDILSLVVGRTFRHATPFLGVRSIRWRGDLDADILLTVPSGTAQQTQSSRNEYREDLVLGIVGVDVAVPRSRAVVRVEGSSDGDSYEVTAGVGVGF